ncbi:hypothetical protein TRFO_29714 [Tritrichomonas foetus]|uniref:Chromo domain-containing protein n=1 Tax=Tritrichomonas foetus TaxID=1144522 RepID=A0A1J4JV20_9EUKA|nr:hypothetical protein TRFO_29714 [Tritrichomonas foetus]|eukprot:OHT03007.1 hypothetical protein TRFO_29714 [Tritrichomonas foetus]
MTQKITYERVLGHNSDKEFFVKIQDQPYCRSKWISKDDFLLAPNSKNLLTNYRNLPQSEQKTSPPFYSTEYDIPDKIVKKENNLFLVQWTHLFHDDLTWEEKLDKQYLNIYRQRKSQQFPKKLNSSFQASKKNLNGKKNNSKKKSSQNSNNHNDKNNSIHYSFLPIRKYTLNQDINVPTEVLDQVQFFFHNFHKHDLSVTEDFGKKSMIAISTFIHFLLKRANDPGPFLIVVEPGEFQEWYDFFSKSRELTTLSYFGSPKSLKNIHELDFFREDSMTLNFQALITIPEILENNTEFLKQVQWKFAFLHGEAAIQYQNDWNFPVYRKILFFTRDQKEILSDIQIIYNALETDVIKKKVDRSAYEIFQQIMEKSKIQPGGKIESPYFYIVECPINDYQKCVCRMLLFDHLSVEHPSSSNFFSIARMFYYVMQHPFVLAQYESKIAQDDLIKCSTKMGVLQKIISETKKEFTDDKKESYNIVIATQIAEIYKLLLDFVAIHYSKNENIYIYFTNIENDDHHKDKTPATTSKTKLSNTSSKSKNMINESSKDKNTKNSSKKTKNINSKNNKARNTKNSKLTKKETHDKDYIDVVEDNNINLNRNAISLSHKNENNISNINLPMKTIDVVICYDGKLKTWQRLLETKITQSSRIYKLEVLDCRENDIKNVPSPTDEAVCKTIALQLMIPSGKISPNQLFSNLYSFDMIFQDPHASVFAEKAFNAQNFWQRLLGAADQFPSNDQFIATKKHYFSENAPFTLHQKKHLVRTFAAFGWGKWNSLINYCGLSLNEKKCISICATVLSQQKSKNNLVAEFYRDYLLQSVPYQQNKEFKFDISAEFPDLLERVLQLSCVNYLFTKSHEKDLENIDFDALVMSKPGIWWTDEHDKALLYAIWKYGYGNFPNFYLDDMSFLNPSNSSSNLSSILSANPINLSAGITSSLSLSLREIMESPVSCGVLTNRSYELINYVTSFVLNDHRLLKVSLLKALPPNSDWTDKEQKNVISYIFSNGLNENDLEETASKIELKDKEKEDIVDYLSCLKKEISKPNPDYGISYIAALRMKMRIVAMKMLHTLIQHIEMKQQFLFYQNVPKWTICGYSISSELEFFLFSELESSGLSSLHAILAMPKFSRIQDIRVMNRLKDEYFVIQRIMEVSEIAQKQNLFSKEPNTNDNEFIEQFGLHLPISLSTTTFIYSFGKIVHDRPGYHAERYIYPVGFRSSKLAPSLSNPNYKVRWFSEIVDGGENPTFRVWQDGSENIFEGNSSSSAWIHALRTCRHNKNVSVSGPDAFLLTNPIVVYFLQKLPGANLCENYIMRDLENNPTVLQFLKDNATTTTTASSNDE